MNHNDARHKLSEYLDGSVSAEERTEIEDHLKTCSVCSEALRELRKTIEHIKSIEEVEPPAWMTQKIMARVRSGAKEKKSLFQRFFFPLSVKLPIQAVAVLFLTVTAFYIYRNIPPAPTPSEKPVREFAAGQEVPAAVPQAKQEGPGITKDASRPAKKVPQAPEYKALDMKLEYEKPAPPVALGKAAGSAPAAAKPPAAPAPARKAQESLSYTQSQESRAPAAKQEAPAPARGMFAKSEPLPEEAALSAGAKAARPGGDAENAIDLTIRVKEFEPAEKQIEKAVTMLGGKTVKAAPPFDRSAVIVSINSKKFSELLSTLKTIGEVKEKAPAPVGREGYLTIRITMTIN